VKLAVLGSGSRGNAVALRSEGATLVVDAGFGPRALARRAEQAGLPLEPLVGIVITHEHGDHARGAVALARRMACPLIATSGTLRALGAEGVTTDTLPSLGDCLRIGPFTVRAARTPHDAAEPVAVVVSDRSGRSVGVAWDLGRPTVGVRHLLRGVHALVLEANHDEVLLQTGPYPAAVRQRISGTSGHLSNRLAAEFAGDLCSPTLEVVVLAHVSEHCNDGGVAREIVSRALRAKGFRGRLMLAEQRAPIPAISLRPASQLALELEPGRRGSPPLPTSPPLPPVPSPGSSV
jgi:phosphoribosyl 1,2-cyclic phosphodiesterase